MSKLMPNYTKCENIVIGGSSRKPNECDIFLSPFEADTECMKHNSVYDITKDQSNVYWLHLDEEKIKWLIENLSRYIS